MKDYVTEGVEHIAVTNYVDQEVARRIKYYSKYTEVLIFERIYDVEEPVRFAKYELRRPGRM